LFFTEEKNNSSHYQFEESKFPEFFEFPADSQVDTRYSNLRDDIFPSPNSSLSQNQELFLRILRGASQPEKVCTEIDSFDVDGTPNYNSAQHKIELYELTGFNGSAYTQNKSCIRIIY